MSKINKYQKRVYRVLTEQKFIVGNLERKTIQARTNNGRRYFFMVAKRYENTKIVERFIKIPENNTKKLLLPFQRQIEIARYIKRHNIINTRGIVDCNYDPKKGIPFAIMETFPANKSNIGFIEANKGAEKLGKKEALKTINQLYKFHEIPVKKLPLELKKILKTHANIYKTFRGDVLRSLNKKVKPLDGKGKSEIFYRVLERRLGIPDIKNKTRKLLVSMEQIINLKNNHIASMVHGDMAPNNLYVFNSGEVELLDLEWVGISKNKAIAMILDFGNLRARSWINKKFRLALDQALLEKYRKNGEEDIGEAVIKLSILRSHINLAGFFENYDWQKQKNRRETLRRKATEEDIKLAFKGLL